MAWRSALALLCACICLWPQDAKPQDPPPNPPPAQPKPQDPAPQPPKTGKPTQSEIDKAIDTGAEYLKKTQGQDGKWDMGPGDLPNHAFKDHMGPQALGHTALNLLAIIVADVDPDDPCIARGFKYLCDHKQEFGHTYNCALTLMAVEEWAAKKMKKDKAKGAADPTNRKDKGFYFRKLGPVKDLAEELTIRIVKGQLADGSWTYAVLAGPVSSGTAVGSTPAPAAPAPLPPQFADIGGDYSNTQYALLGLRSATECGIRFNQDAWLNAMQVMLNRQEKQGPKVKPFPVPAATEEMWSGKKPGKDVPHGTHTQEGRSEFEARGWGYTVSKSRPAPYGAMTSIGIASLVMCKYYLRGHARFKPELVDQVNKAIEDGCAWMAVNFNIKDNCKWTDPNVEYKNSPPKIDGYYMYGIERAGVLASVVKFGEHDWYALGARLLVDQQQADGSWSSEMFYEPKPTISTCFAILFLKRATQPIIETGGEPVPAPPKK
jgi:hypothetical protein